MNQLVLDGIMSSGLLLLSLLVRRRDLHRLLHPPSDIPSHDDIPSQGSDMDEMDSLQSADHVRVDQADY